MSDKTSTISHQGRTKLKTISTSPDNSTYGKNNKNRHYRFHVSSVPVSLITCKDDRMSAIYMPCPYLYTSNVHISNYSLKIKDNRGK